jgi:ribose transport system permease protein
MRELLQSRFVSNYGMLFVLLLLCGYFSMMTVAEQHPVSPRAAHKIANFLADRFPETKILIVVPSGSESEVYGEAVRRQLVSHGVELVGLVAGKPADATSELRKLGEAGTKVDFVVTQYAAANWYVLTKKGRQDLAEEFPALAGLEVVKPQSYRFPTFLMPSHLLTVANQTAIVAIVAIGMTMVIIAAGIDLSVGSLIALSGVIAAVSIRQLVGDGEPSMLAFVPGCLLAILVCAALGALSGLIVTRFDVPAFIVTLAVMQIARGLAYKVAGSPDPVRIESETFHNLSAGDVLAIPNPVIVMVVLYAIAHFVMSKTTLGRYLYAVGGNPEAARLSGVPVKTVIVFAYAMCALLAGLGGVLDASLFRSARASGALGWELQIIAAVVVGGTSLAGGEGKVLGTLIGALILGVIQDGMSLTNVDPYTQLIVFGLLIIVAVLVDKLKSRNWGSSP